MANSDPPGHSTFAFGMALLAPFQTTPEPKPKVSQVAETGHSLGVVTTNIGEDLRPPICVVSVNENPLGIFVPSH